jgi:hypothetical protein
MMNPTVRPCRRDREIPPDTQNGERPQGDAPQGNPVDSSNEQTKEESDGQK